MSTGILTGHIVSVIIAPGFLGDLVCYYDRGLLGILE